MKRLHYCLFALLACLCAPGLARAKAKKHESKATALVELFLKTPVDQLPADEVDEFMAVDAQKLPERLRGPCEAKKAQLRALRKVYELENGGGPRSGAPAPKGCSAPLEGGEALVQYLGKAGFALITRQEKDWLAANTHCTQKQMMCEFSLTVVQRKAKDKRKPKTWYLLHAKDPLYMLVGMKRQGQVRQGSGSFGESSFPTCR